MENIWRLKIWLGFNDVKEQVYDVDNDLLQSFTDISQKRQECYLWLTIFFIHIMYSGLAKLTNLKRLTLDHNNVTSLEINILEELINLEYLSVENNYISSIQGLKVSVNTWWSWLSISFLMSCVWERCIILLEVFPPKSISMMDLLQGRFPNTI